MFPIITLHTCFFFHDEFYTPHVIGTFAVLFICVYKTEQKGLYKICNFSMIYFKENFVWAVRDLNPTAKCIVEQFT